MSQGSSISSELADKPKQATSNQWYPKLRKLLEGLHGLDSDVRTEITSMIKLLNLLGEGSEEYRNGVLYLVIKHPNQSKNIFLLYQQEQLRSAQYKQERQEKEAQNKKQQLKLDEKDQALKKLQDKLDSNDKQAKAIVKFFSQTEMIKKHLKDSGQESSQPAEQSNPEITKTKLRIQPNLTNVRGKLSYNVERQQSQSQEHNAHNCFNHNANLQHKNREKEEPSQNQPQGQEAAFGQHFPASSGNNQLSSIAQQNQSFQNSVFELSPPENN